MRILCWLVDNTVFLVTRSHTFGLQDNENKFTKLCFSVNFVLLKSICSNISQVSGALVEPEQLHTSKDMSLMESTDQPIMSVKKCCSGFESFLEKHAIKCFYTQFLNKSTGIFKINHIHFPFVTQTWRWAAQFPCKDTYVVQVKQFWTVKESLHLFWHVVLESHVF